MSGATSIEWCDTVWNPVTGCTKVSAGCKNCYAEAVARRFWKGRKFGDVRFHEDRLGDPLKWRKPRRVFVNSMSDLFHVLVDFSRVAAIFGVMAACPMHTFIVLTKRPERAIMFDRWFRLGQSPLASIEVRTCTLAAAKILREPFAKHAGPGARGELPWPLPNVQIGVSVEDQQTADERISLLLQIPAARRIVSYEPALGPVDFDAVPVTVTPGFFGSCLQWHHRGECHRRDGVEYPTIDQIIVGGESGPNARPCNVDWIRATIQQCKAAAVPCFVKQLGSRPYDPSWYGDGTPDGSRMRLDASKGNDMAEWPADLRVREVAR